LHKYSPILNLACLYNVHAKTTIALDYITKRLNDKICIPLKYVPRWDPSYKYDGILMRKG